MAGKHLLKSWSSTQPVVTLSSGEAELHGAVRGGAGGLGMLAILRDLGGYCTLMSGQTLVLHKGSVRGKDLGRCVTSILRISGFNNV